MGHRTLHAVPTGDGRYDCYRTQCDGLAAFAPSGGIPNPPESDRPVAKSVDAAGVLSVLDHGDEVLFVHGEETAYLVCRLTVPALVSERERTRIPTAATAASPTTVALVAVSDGRAARRLDADLRTVREALGDAVDAGLVPRPMAEGYVRAFLGRHPDVREVVWLPPAD